MSNMDAAAYAAATRPKVQAWIQAGDCYQVNLARRLGVAAEGDPWTAYVQLRALNPAPFAAYLNLPFGRVLSSSPERFLRLATGQVEPALSKAPGPGAQTRRRTCVWPPNWPKAPRIGPRI